MKMQKQAIIGLVTGFVIALGVTLIFIPKDTSPAYGSCKIDGNTLKSIYNGDFKSLVLNFKYSSTTNRFELEPSISNAAGTNVAVNAALLSQTGTGRTFSGNRTLVPYTLEHNRVHGLLQLQTLDSIAILNSGCYFILSAADYSAIDPRDITHIYYKIVPYTSRGAAINVRGIDVRAFQLNPNPPGHSY